MLIMILNILGGGLTAFLVSALSTPIVKKLAIFFGVVDQPSERKIHKNPIPHLGGIAICLGVLGALFLLSYGPLPHLPNSILIGATSILFLGVIDDVFAIEARWKLFGQIAVSAIPVSQGIIFTHLSIPFVGTFALGSFAAPVTIFFIISLINTLNLIDGLDGLAAGISLIVSATIGFIAWNTGNIPTLLLMSASIGATLGFLKYNFPPAKIFMGDSGSMFLGYILALASLQGVLQETLSWRICIPIMALGIPILDMIYAIIRRLKNKQAIFKPDRGHFHHELLNSGLTQKQIALFSYFITTILGILCILIFLSSGTQLYLVVGLSSLLIGSGLVLFKRNRKLIFRLVRTFIS